MKIGIYGQFYHAQAGPYIEELLDSLDTPQVDVHIEREFLELIRQHKSITKSYSHFQIFEELDSSFDLFFSIGGDGTILKSASFIRDLGIPIVGINTGRLGFLATVNKEDIKGIIPKLLAREFSISERTVLGLKTTPENPELCDGNYALNEITVNRKNSTSMITIEAWLNDEYLTAYWADGLIVSTPTGSTGYSLSCGGPVIMPSTTALCLTPIAPHNLNARPLIIKEDTRVTLKIIGRDDEFLVSMDSRTVTVKNHTTLHISTAPFKIRLVELHGDSFIQTIRKKLLWGEDKRN